MNKIITLGDIFRNLETEEKAFKFLGYIKDMQKEIEKLQNQLQQKENIIKEVRELLQKANIYRNYDDEEDDTWYTDLNIDKAIEILDKENK